MVGTTRSRVKLFMNKFRKLGFIEYDDAGLKINNSLPQRRPSRRIGAEPHPRDIQPLSHARLVQNCTTSRFESDYAVSDETFQRKYVGRRGIDNRGPRRMRHGFRLP